MNQAVFTSPMARGLNEAPELQKVDESVEFKDGRGDKWSLKHLVRNETHPNYYKPSSTKGKSSPDTFNSCSAFCNHRTGDVHEGGMEMHLGGTAEPKRHEYHRFYHIAQYSEAKKK
jgi:hypothetical protein